MIEEKVLKEIEILKRAYLEKDKERREERNKLLELAEKYVAENDILNDLYRLNEIVAILPDSKLQDRLRKYRFDLEEKQQPLQEGEQGTAATESGREIDQTNSQENDSYFEEVASELKEINCQNQIFRKKEKAFWEESKNSKNMSWAT